MIKRQGKIHLSLPCFRLLALFSTIFLLSINLWGCTPFHDPKTQGQEKTDEFYLTPENGYYYNDLEFVRTITLAMEKTDQIDAIWQHIPSSQRKEINLTSFLRYLNLLQQALQDPVISIQRAKTAETLAVKQKLLRHAPDLAQEIESSNYWILWASAKNAEQKQSFGILVPHNENGIPYFSPKLLDRQSYLYDYVQLYFNALAENNRQALFSLLCQNRPAASPTDIAAFYSRTDGLLKFYKALPDDTFNDYTFVELMPGSAEIILTEHKDNDEIARRRTVYFYEKNGLIDVEEKIVEKLKPQDTRVWHQGKPIYNLQGDNNQIDSATIYEKLGIPLALKKLPAKNDGSATELDIEQAIAKEDREKYIAGNYRAIWAGLDLEFEGSLKADTLDFAGEIKRIDLNYSKWSTGSGLHVGQPIEELLIKYPFARENKYLFSHKSTDGSTTTLVIQVEANHIARLTLLHNKN